MQTSNFPTHIQNVPVTFLPDVEGVANNMGDYFQPDDTKDKIVARKGMMKERDGTISPMIMASRDGVTDFSIYQLIDDKWEFVMGNEGPLSSEAAKFLMK